MGAGLGICQGMVMVCEVEPAGCGYGLELVVGEAVAEMALKTLRLNPEAEMPQYILDKHYKRKHGRNAYYGQRG